MSMPIAKRRERRAMRATRCAGADECNVRMVLGLVMDQELSPVLPWDQVSFVKDIVFGKLSRSMLRPPSVMGEWASLRRAYLWQVLTRAVDAKVPVQEFLAQAYSMTDIWASVVDPFCRWLRASLTEILTGVGKDMRSLISTTLADRPVTSKALAANLHSWLADFADFAREALAKCGREQVLQSSACKWLTRPRPRPRGAAKPASASSSAALAGTMPITPNPAFDDLRAMYDLLGTDFKSLRTLKAEILAREVEFEPIVRHWPPDLCRVPGVAELVLAVLRHVAPQLGGCGSVAKTLRRAKAFFSNPDNAQDFVSFRSIRKAVPLDPHVYLWMYAEVPEVCTASTWPVRFPAAKLTTAALLQRHPDYAYV